jgi:hypothetical protein
MLVKAVLIFLLVMVIVAMLGKALFPGAAKRLALRRKTAACPACGRPQIGRAPCSCKGPAR